MEPIVDKIPPEKLGILKDALSTPDNPQSQSIIEKARQRGWIQEEQKAEPSIAQKAGAFALGAAESFNPLPLVKTADVLVRAAGKNDGLGGLTQEQYMEQTPPSLRKVPKSFAERISEAAQESPVPDLTIKSGLKLIPGVKEQVKALPQDWERYGGLAGMAYGIGSGLRGAIKGSPVKQAAKAEQSIPNELKFLTGEAEGPVLNAILERPDKVRKLLNAGKLSPDDLAIGVRDQLLAKQEHLGKVVGKFRQMAEADVTPKIDASPVLAELKGAIGKSIGDTGQSSLNQGAKSELDQIFKLVPRGPTLDDIQAAKLTGEKLPPPMLSSAGALKIVDKIDALTKGDFAAANNVEKPVIDALRKIRANLKEKIRKASGEAEAWAKADDEFSTFMDVTEQDSKIKVGLIDKFSGDGRTQAVDSLLNKNKDPIRDRIREALSIGEKDTSAADQFFDALANRKAAQNLKALDVTKADPVRDQVNRLFQRWMSKGQWAGAAAGSAIGAKFGSTGALVGMPVGGFAGRIAIEPFARKVSSPQYLLDQVSKSKLLSKEAKEFATDLNWIQKRFGVEGANLFWNSLKGSVPAARELGDFIGATGTK